VFVFNVSLVVEINVMLVTLLCVLGVWLASMRFLVLVKDAHSTARFVLVEYALSVPKITS
jgi:hypothetical protein